jgi:hypothetical protein
MISLIASLNDIADEIGPTSARLGETAKPKTRNGKIQFKKIFI